MKRMRYSEEQVTSILNEREAGSLGGRLGPHARHHRVAGPPLEVEVRRHVGTRPQAAQGRELARELAPEAHGRGPGPGPCGRPRTSLKCQKSTDARRQEEGGGPAPEGPPGQRLGGEPQGCLSHPLTAWPARRGARGCGGIGPRRARRPDRTGAGRPASRSSQLANGRRIRIGPETASKAMRFWSGRSGAALDFIQPGKPTQNAFVESFDGNLQDSCLKALVHWTSPTPSASWTAWRCRYNHERSHRSAGTQRPPSGPSKPPEMVPSSWQMDVF